MASTPEAAGNALMPLILLAFLGSGFVPTESMPAAIRWFAEYQSFTPIMETDAGLTWRRETGVCRRESGVKASGNRHRRQCVHADRRD
ncbi:hypothetical protein Acsp03_67370 [Actinomadura sp. NBRC 104412]|nr:hypothetical protein Acsp03_67370 [Actinomadura sp. NBRC 104412]